LCLGSFGVNGGLGDFLGDLNLSVARSTDFHEFLDVGLLGGFQVVSGTTVVRDIKSNFFLKRIDTEDSGHVQKVEERSHDGTNPYADPDNGDELAQKKLAASSKEQSVAIGGVSGNGLETGVSEKTNSEDSPGSVSEVDRDGIDGIIDLHVDEEFGESVVDASSNDSDDNSGPRVDGGASSSDGNKTSEGTVHGHGQIIRDFTSLLGFDGAIQEHGGNTSTCSGKGGSDGTKGGSGGGVGVGDDQSRSGVESVPSEPQDEGSEDLEGSGVGREVGGGLKGISVVIIESSSARSKDDGGDKGSSSSSHVDNTGSSEIDHTNAKERLGGERGDETVGTPDGSDNDGVDKCGEEKRVAEVGGHLASFGNGSGNNGGGGGSEGELEEPSDVFSSGGESGDGKGAVTNEGTGSSVRETVSQSVETNGTTTGIQQVLEHDVLDVLLTNGTSAKHGETGLHQKDGSSCEKQEEGVDTGGHGVDTFIDHTGGKSCTFSSVSAKGG